MTESLPSRAPTGDSAATVLLVDDDDDWRIALSRWLERERLRVVALARGEWVVSAIELHHPDLVILDVNLPGMNGFDLLGTVRARCPEVRVLVTTAFGGPAMAQSARRLGADGYLDKPFRLADLLSEIRRLGVLGEDERRTGSTGRNA